MKVAEKADGSIDQECEKDVAKNDRFDAARGGVGEFGINREDVDVAGVGIEYNRGRDKEAASPVKELKFSLRIEALD